MAWLVSSAVKLPGVNFEAPPMINDLNFQFDDVFAKEQRDRLQLVMGSYLTGGAHYGIVDSINPRSSLPNDGRPLSVSINSSVTTTVDVQPGVAVTKAGNIIISDSLVTNLSLASLENNVSNVVYVEYSTIDDTTTNTLTRYNTVEARRRIFAPVSQVIKTALLSDYQNPSLFPPERLNDVVVLAVVTNSTTTASGLIIDMSNNTALINRPWFSAVDADHRALVGTGSSAVPHSLGLNDLSQGELTLYQQMLRHGIVISKDYDVPGCPGKLNVEFIPSSGRDHVDTTGIITGTVGQRYVNLIGYPLRLLAAKSLDTVGGVPVDNDIAVSFIPHTNILLIPTLIGSEQNNEFIPTNGFNVYYTSSSAVEPPTVILSNDQLQFGTPDTTKELFVTGGKAYNTLPSNTMNIGNCGPFPRTYTVYLDQDRQFLLAPQVVGCVKYVEPSQPNGIGNAIQIPEYSMFGPARITVGLNDMSSAPFVLNPNFSVAVTVYGKDINGYDVQETLTFSSVLNNYAPVETPVSRCGFGVNISTVPDYISQPPKLFLTTSNVFTSVSSWNVSSYNSIPASTVVMMWADLLNPITTNLNDLLPVAKFSWSGENACKIYDVRPVDKTIQKPEALDRTASDLDTLLASSYLTSPSVTAVPLAAEDFNNPHWLDNLKTQKSRYSDGLQSYFWPGPADPSFVPESYAEYYYTRAILLPLTTNQDCVLLQLLADRYQTAADMSKNLVQYRLATVLTPDQWGSWTTAAPISSVNSMRRIDLTAGAPPYLKIQLRFVTHNVRGFISIMKGI